MGFHRTHPAQRTLRTRLFLQARQLRWCCRGARGASTAPCRSPLLFTTGFTKHETPTPEVSCLEIQSGFAALKEGRYSGIVCVLIAPRYVGVGLASAFPACLSFGRRQYVLEKDEPIRIMFSLIQKRFGLLRY